MWAYIILFIVTALFGFIYGKKMHLKQLASVLLTTRLIPDESIGKVVDLVGSYNELRRKAKKETKEAYKKVLVAESIDKMKKEERNNG